MDVDQFYRQGFTTTTLPEELLSEITIEMRMQPYRSETGGHPGVFYPTEASTPSIWKFWKTLGASDYYSYLRRTWGDFTYFYSWGFKYALEQNVPFHGDMEKGMPVLNILYLSFDSFVEDDGGYLKLARLKRPLNVRNLYELPDEDVVGHWRICPNNGVLVTINNTDPLIVHSVERLYAKKDRYTLSCLFGHDNAKDHINLNERYS